VSETPAVPRVADGRVGTARPATPSAGRTFRPTRPTPWNLAADDPGLVEVSLSKAPLARELWLLTRPGAPTAKRIRVVTDFLVDLIQRERSLFEGT
jgi:hypothetical protein